MIWQEITRAQISDMLLQVSIYGTKRDADRFKRLDYERKQKVTFVLRRRAARHRKDGENPYDVWTIKEVIEDALRCVFVDLGEGL